MAGNDFGYPDWRRQTERDQAPFALEENTAETGPVEFGPEYCGLWETTAFNISANGGLIDVTIRWYTDAAETIMLGATRFVLDCTAGNSSARGRVVNRGPFVKVLLSRIGGGNWTLVSCFLFESNRMINGVFNAPEGGQVPLSAVALGAGAGSTLTVGTMLSGLATLGMLTGAAPGRFDVNALSLAGVWTRLFSRTLAAGTSDNFLFGVPFAQLQLSVFNTGGVAGNFTMNLGVPEGGG